MSSNSAIQVKEDKDESRAARRKNTGELELLSQWDFSTSRPQSALLAVCFR